MSITLDELDEEIDTCRRMVSAYNREYRKVLFFHPEKLEKQQEAKNKAGDGYYVRDMDIVSVDAI